MPRLSRVAIVTLVLLAGAVVGLQAVRDRLAPQAPPAGAAENLLYLRSPEVVRRVALSYRALAADVYWIRAVQHYGGTRRSSDPQKRYDLLAPLLDLATTLDPLFNIAYRFGAIFLAEPYPNGPARPDLAIALLAKGLVAQPAKWEYAEDIGFVHYWWRQDYASAAAWFRRAALMPGAPNWLHPLAAVTLAEGGNRASARLLWQQLLSSDAEWLRNTARFRLAQLDALDRIDALGRVVQAYMAREGRRPRAWEDLRREGDLADIELDPAGFPYRLDADSGTVTLDPASSLNPLPALRSGASVR